MVGCGPSWTGSRHFSASELLSQALSQTGCRKKAVGAQPPPPPGQLAQYILDGPPDHIPSGYEQHASGGCMLAHRRTGIQVCDELLDLTLLAPDDQNLVVLFYYTDSSVFHEYLMARHEQRTRSQHSLAEISELMELMRNGSRSCTPVFGEGLYLTSKDPNAFSDKREALCNNHWPSRKELEDEEHEGKFAQAESALRRSDTLISKVVLTPAARSMLGPQNRRNEYICDRVARDFVGRADFCIPVLVPQRLAYYIWQKPLPDLAVLGVEIGCNCFGERQWDGRDIWVVGLPVEGGLPAEIEEKRRKAELLTRVRGGGHAETLATLDQLAELLGRVGRMQEAELLLRRTLEARQCEHGEEHMATLQSKIRLGTLLARTDRCSDAEDLLHQARDSAEQTQGPTHAATQEACWQLVQVLLVLGKNKEAKKCIERLVSHLEEFHADEIHRDMLMARLRRARVLNEMRHDSEAIKELRRVEQKSRNEFGPDEPMTLEAMSLLAVLLERDGQLAETERLHELLVSDLNRYRGATCPFTLAALNNYSMFLKTIGKHEEAERHLRASLQKRGWVSEEQMGTPDEPMLTSLNNLASLLEAMGKYNEAEPLQKQVVRLRARLLGPEHPSTLESCNNLAVLLQRRGKHQEAEKLYRRTLKGHEKVAGELSVAIGMSLHNLGELCLEEGKMEEAEKLLIRALESRRRMLGVAKFDTLQTLDSLARLRRTTGRSLDAEEMLQQAAKRCQEDLGPTHELTLMSLNHLAIHLQATGKREDAINMLRQPLEQQPHRHDEVGPTQLEAWNNLALLLREVGEFLEAEKFMKGVVQGRKRLCGPRHQSTLTAINNLGVLLQDMGEYGKAEPLLHDTWRFREETLGPEHPETLTAVNNLATVLEAVNQHEKAVEMYERALQGKQNSLGRTHPSTIKTIDNLTDLLTAMRRRERAERLMREAVLDQEQALGAEHTATTASRMKLAALLVSFPLAHLSDPGTVCNGKREEAEFHLQRALEVRQRALGYQHRDTLESAGRLAELLAGARKYDKAEDLQRRCLQHREVALRAMRQGDPQIEIARDDLAVARSNLAVVLHMKGKYTEAEALHKDTLDDCKRRLGRAHSRTLSVSEDLASLYTAVGRHEEAEHLWQEILNTRKQALSQALTPPPQARADTWSEEDLRAEHLQLLTAHHELAMSLQQLPNRKNDAVTHLYHAWKGREESLGELHDATQISLSQLAQLLRSFGPSRFEEAEWFFRNLWKVRRRAKGDAHASTLIALSQLATICWQQDKYTEAEQYFREVLNVRKAMGQSHEAVGPAHAAELATALNLARVLQIRGQLAHDQGHGEEAEASFSQAEDLFAQVLEDRQAKLGAKHRYAQAAKGELENLRRCRGGGQGRDVIGWCSAA